MAVLRGVNNTALPSSSGSKPAASSGTGVVSVAHASRRSPAGLPVLPTAPFTHHDILAIVGPFAHSGRHVDLAATDRQARKLVFKPTRFALDPAAGLPFTAVCETLVLENLHDETYRLSRMLTHGDDTDTALLITEGTDPGDLLARIDAVARHRQFHCGDGFFITQHHRLQVAGRHDPDHPHGSPARLILTHAVARLLTGLNATDGLTLTLSASRVSGIPAALELSTRLPDQLLALPDDLLAVLGWHWSCLTRAREGWRATVQLKGSGLARSMDAEHKMLRAAQHLVRTLAEPPARFHAQQVGARWTVVLRRMLPLLIALLILAGVAMVPRIELAENSIFRMLIFHLPPLLLLVFFCMREMPRFEIPRPPRASNAPSWRQQAS